MSLVEDWNDFEAVLVCTNSLPEWDDAATKRAFQTYQFDDATTSGDEPTFKHVETGTIIHYEGNELAIAYGDGGLYDVFLDLIPALHSLGWEEAEIYHPQTTMNALLADIGKAIPASMSFEVRPAQMNKPVNEYPEAKQLMAHAALLMNPDAAPSTIAVEEESAIRAGLTSVLENTPENTAPIPSVASSTPISVQLLDDEESAEEDLPLQVQIVAANPAAPVPVFLDDEPPVFELPSADEPAYEEPYQAEMTIVEKSDEAPIAASSVAASNEAASDDGFFSGVPIEQEIEVSLQPEIEKLAHTTFKPLQASSSDQKGSDLSGLKFVRVGRSVLCFDLPEDPLVVEELQLIADEFAMPSEDMVHLFPGTLNEAVRWNVLGEIDLAYPWFAELLATAMNTPAPCIKLVSSILLALKRNKPDAEIRDLLMFTGKSQDEMLEAVATVSSATSLLIKHAAKSGELDQTIKHLITQLGPLALASEGQSFVDLNIDSVGQSFTVMEIAKSPVQRVYIIHVDALDGPFILWLTHLLQMVATKNAATHRVTPIPSVEPSASPEPETKPPELNAEVVGAVSELVLQLQRLGVPLPLPEKVE